MDIINGITQKLSIKENRITVIPLLGKEIGIPYSTLKRIDYCYAEKFKTGYVAFIDYNNQRIQFNYNSGNNEPIKNMMNSIAMNNPHVLLKKYAQEENKNDRSIYIVPIFGHKELGLPASGFAMSQKFDGEIYFNNDTRVFYSLTGYQWSGPVYDFVTNRVEQNTSINQTSTNSKALKIGIGAVLGNAVAGSIGAAVGTAMGAGSKKKSKTVSAGSANTMQTSYSVEKNSSALITLKNRDNNKIYRLSFNCNSSLDAQIKCFDFSIEQTKQALVADTSMSLKGIKALKELLDMGAITQEEFEQKKRQLLNM